MEFKTQTLLLMKARDMGLAMQLSAFGDISSLNQTSQPCHQFHCLIPVTPIARPLTTGKQRDQNACILWEGWFPKREEIERERERKAVYHFSLPHSTYQIRCVFCWKGWVHRGKKSQECSSQGILPQKDWGINAPQALVTSISSGRSDLKCHRTRKGLFVYLDQDYFCP